ncbi:MAG: response regulator, partial [Gammaproteobacteria bacterium]
MNQTSPALRVMIIDDHTLFRRGLAELLDHRGIDVVAAVGDGETGWRVAQELRPDIILLDLRMPQVDGLSVLERLVETLPGTPVVMLTTSDDDRDLVEALRAGTRGYLLKDMEPDQLVGSLAEVMAGKTVVAPDMTSALAQAVQGEE